MANGFEPFEGNGAPDKEPVPAGVPVARPVELPYALPSRQEPHAFLLLNITRRVALADIGALIVLILVAELAAELVAGSLIGILIGTPAGAPDVDEETFARIARMPVLSFRALGSIIVVWAIVTYRRQRAASVGVGRSGFIVNGLLGIAAMAVSYGLIMVWQFLVWYNWPDLLQQMIENADRILVLIPKMHPLTFGAVALVIGLYEELVFRGFLMPRLRRITGSWTAAVIFSTALFTALHWFDQTAAALVPIAILSLVFSVVTIWRRSIVPAIIGHFLFDWSQFIGLYVTAGDKWT